MAEIVSDVLIAGEEMVEMAEVSEVGAAGPLGPFVAGFAAELSRQGYKPQPVGKQLGLVAALSGWLAAEGVAVSGLSSDVAERFCAARRAAGHTDRATVRALDPLLGYLRALGVAPPASRSAPAGPVEELLARFRRYLEHERGLVPAAARGYVDEVRPFVARFDGPDGLELWRVDVAEVRGFVVEVCPRLGRRAAQLTVVALRALLRFLHLEGVLERSLAGAVPSVAGWRLSGLPKRLEPGEVDALLGSCNRSTVIGLRDLAILTVLSRLGLRAGEVAALSLDDIDWRAGELIVHGKGARSERAGSPSSSRRPRAEPGSAWSTRTGCGTPRRRRCCAAARRSRKSARCCATATRRPPRSMPRSTARRSGRSRVRGRERPDERPPRFAG